MSVVVAIPSKGRLRGPTEARLAAAGFAPAKPDAERGYPTELENLPGSRLLLAEAAAVPGILARGEADAGFTGEDLAAEKLPDAGAALSDPLPLGYGHARLSLAVPECWIDVDDLADFEDVAFAFRRIHGRRLRVATAFPRLAGRFLAARVDCEIVPSRGPAEAAPLAGLAEAVIDLVATGATLRANRLKVPEGGVVFESEACFYGAAATASGSAAAEAVARLRAALAAAA